jgi:lysophospholipase L1-like esterase
MNTINRHSQRKLPGGMTAIALLLLAAWPLGSWGQTPAKPLTPLDSGYLAQPANPALPSLFLVGDSTVRNGNGTGHGGQWGWGDCLAPYFATNRINFVNDALGGTSSRTFFRDRWPHVKALIKPGDFLLLQFGHNDSGPVNDAQRARGTLKGAGPESVTITNLVTKKVEVVHSFGWYESQIIAEARDRGATPMVCSLIPRNNWKDGRVVRNSYAGWARDVALAAHAPILDINEIIARSYDRLGPAKVAPLFIVGAGPHTSRAGAETNAICVVSALKGLPGNPLLQFLSPRAAAIGPADLTQPAPAPAVRVPDLTTPE